MEPQKKTDERSDTTVYAVMASEMRRMVDEVQGIAAKHACKVLAERYEELARGVPPHRLSKTTPSKH